jgi:MFS family permease
MITFRRHKSRETDPYDHVGELASFLRVMLRFCVAVGSAVTALLASVFILSIIDRFMVTRYVLEQPFFFVPFNALYGGGLAYTIALIASRLGTMVLLIFAAVVMLSGVIMAMVLSTNVDWWTRAISWLGVDEYGIIFNLTFIIVGVLLVAVLQDKLGDLAILRERGLFQSPYFDHLRRAMLVMCFLVAGIGVFPYGGITADLHQVVSSLALVSFILLSYLSGVVIPIYPRRYYQITSVIVTSSVFVIIAHYVLRWINFSIMELILLAIGGLWIATFYVYTRGYIAKHDPTLITGRILET